MVQFKLNDVEYCCEITGMTLVDAKRCGIAIKPLMAGVISAIRSAKGPFWTWESSMRANLWLAFEGIPGLIGVSMS